MEKQIQRIDNIIYGLQLDTVPDRKGLGRTIFDKMQEYQDRECQIDATTNESQTYEQINKKLVRIALEMRARGIEKDDIVMNCSTNSMDAILPICSALYLNAVTVTLDSSTSLRDTIYLSKKISPKLIFVEESSISLIENTVTQIDVKPDIVVLGSHQNHSTFAEFLKPHYEEDGFVPDPADDIGSTAMVFFSSGTTGLPKAITISHYAMLKSCNAFRHNATDLTTFLFYTTFHWISAHILFLTGIFSGGRRIVPGKFTPDAFMKCVRDFNVTISFLPTNYALYFDEKNTKNSNIESLAELMIGGSAINPEQVQNLMRYFPKIGIYIVYGQTEACGVVTMFSKHTYSLSRYKLGSCGVPSVNIKLKIVDMESGETLGPDHKGEICFVTDGLFSGYYQESGEDCFDKDGFIKSGDVGYFDEDNCVFFCDRIKEMFKYQSWPIVPASIEAVIYQHPAVREAIVIGIPHDLDEHHSLALVILKHEQAVSEDELLNFVNAKVLDREMLRAGLKIVKRFPRTCTGKVPRYKITQMILANNYSELM